mmetsp:Transcript_124419/g.295279  ORF Transcript_124419/g.295279 Transcript_124419/m.295279 type:complete len:208 (+) Transcript_124419:874-1497(+)
MPRPETRAHEEGASWHRPRVAERLLQRGPERAVAVQRICGVPQGARGAPCWRIGLHRQLRERALQLPVFQRALFHLLHQRVRVPAGPPGGEDRPAGGGSGDPPRLGLGAALRHHAGARDLRGPAAAPGGHRSSPWGFGANSWASLRPVAASRLPARVPLPPRRRAHQPHDGGRLALGEGIRGERHHGGDAGNQHECLGRSLGPPSLD